MVINIKIKLKLKDKRKYSKKIEDDSIRHYHKFFLNTIISLKIQKFEECKQEEIH